MAKPNENTVYSDEISQRVNELGATRPTYNEILENIKYLTDSLDILKDGNVSFRKSAVDLAANSILLAGLDKSVSIQKKMTSNKHLEIKELKWYEDPLKNSESQINTSHFNWLEKNLPSFWVKVFGRTLSETGSENIISKHASECFKYKSKWERAGIPLQHGAALYLLTYTPQFGNTEKQFSCMWVINNYDRYKDFLAPM
jgi:hypothetical protein